jgi:hypothetical protein
LDGDIVGKTGLEGKWGGFEGGRILISAWGWQFGLHVYFRFYCSEFDGISAEANGSGAFIDGEPGDIVRVGRRSFHLPR